MGQERPVNHQGRPSINKGTVHRVNPLQAFFSHIRNRPSAAATAAPMAPTWLDLPLDRASLQATPTLPHDSAAPGKSDARRLKAALDLLARAIDAARMT